MKKRVVILLLLLGSLLLADPMFGSLLGRAYRQITTGAAGDRIHSALAERAADVLVFGGSLAEQHVDPSEFEPELGWTAYNTGCHGQDIYYVRMLESLLLRRGCTSRLFIYVVDWSDLYCDDPAPSKAFAPYADEDPLIAQILDGGSTLERLKQNSPTQRHHRLAGPNLTRAVTATSEGGCPVDRFSSSNPQDQVLMSRDRPEAVEGWDLALMVKKLRMYADLVHAARENSTDVWFVVGPTYRADAEMGHRERFALRQLQLVALQAGARFLVLDESSRAEFSDQRYYDDQRHLSAAGAQLLLRELVRLVRAESSELSFKRREVETPVTGSICPQAGH